MLGHQAAQAVVGHDFGAAVRIDDPGIVVGSVVFVAGHAALFIRVQNAGHEAPGVHRVEGGEGVKAGAGKGADRAAGFVGEAADRAVRIGEAGNAAVGGVAGRERGLAQRAGHTA